MILKYMIKGLMAGLIVGLDEWADSLTQEQFNMRMRVVALFLFIGTVVVAGYIG